MTELENAHENKEKIAKKHGIFSEEYKKALDIWAKSWVKFKGLRN